jgi:ubiquinone/menaquinone biosynthesis C-methylase UbiE
MLNPRPDKQTGEMQRMPRGTDQHEADKAFYSASVHYLEPDQLPQFAAHAAVVSGYLGAVIAELRKKAEGLANIDLLELGAGTCLTSLMIRQRIANARLTCLDISLSRMSKLIEETARFLGTHHREVELIEADISVGLPLEDARFDVVVFDASLHHSRNIWCTLRECRRVLRSRGVVVALREQYLAPLTYRFALKRLLRTPEVRAGVAENAYLKDQYAYYLRATGFEPTFHPVRPSAKWLLLSPLNGIAYSKWSIWAPKAGAPEQA